MSLSAEAFSLDTREKSPVARRNLPATFVEPLDGRDGVSVVAEEGAWIIRYNGGGVKLHQIKLPDNGCREIHPDEVMADERIPVEVRMAFRRVCGATVRGFIPPSDSDGELPKPYLKGCYCFEAPDGTKGVGFRRSRQALQVEFWRPEDPPKPFIPNGFNDALQLHDYSLNGDHC